MLRRSVRILIALVAVVVVSAAAAASLGHLVGERVYLSNRTSCDLLLMEEHDSVKIGPGERALVKSGLIARTPSLVISVNWDMWFDGLHFSSNGVLEGRFGAKWVVPELWFNHTLIGSEVTYEISADGSLGVASTAASELHAPGQPSGFPLAARLGTKSTGCVNAKAT